MTGAQAQATSAARADQVLSVEDLHVDFPGGVQALRGVSLSIRPGEIVGVVGESGSGKSVLALAVLGLLAREARIAGSVRLAGEEMVGASAEQRRLARRAHGGAVFQDPMTSLNPTTRIGPQVVEVAGTREAALRLLAEVRIPEPERRFRQYPHELSGGLRQRVMIAIAIAREPALIVADEPTTALDVVVQAEIARLFTGLRERTSSSLLFITHDLALAANLADRIVVMYGGRIAETGTAADIVRAPSHPYTSALLATRLTLSQRQTRRLRTLPGEPPDPRTHAAACPFAPRCRFAADVCTSGLPSLAPAATHPGADACVRSGELARPLQAASAGAAEGHVAASIALVRDGSPRSAPRLRRGAPRTVAPAGVALAVGSLRKSFGAVEVLREVSLSVAVGECVALVGASGCGKTTLLRIVVGLERPGDGTIAIGGSGHCQMVFQDVGASLTPWMTVEALLAERLAIERVPRDRWPARIDAALALVGLPRDVRASRPVRLSGGQRQRVALARAVIVPPALLACDEPTSALDVSLAATALNLLRDLREELEMATLIVTHDLAIASASADRIVVMDDGRVVEDGVPRAVLDSPRSESTRRLIAAVPSVEAVSA